jgi:hypothetical protein
VKSSIDKYWEKNKALLNNLEESQISQTIPTSISAKSTNAKKRKVDSYAEEVRNKNMELNNNNSELPKIPLFKQNEKKILLGVLPEKELKKYEKRYDYVDKEKNNLLRKYHLETKQLEKENKDLEFKYEYSNNQLNEGEQKNKKLENQLNEQQKEIERLKIK